MAFEYTEIGPLVARDPQAAAEKLAGLLAAQGGNLTRLVAALSVDYRTVTRWLAKLEAAGYDVRKLAGEKQAAETPAEAPPPSAPSPPRRRTPRPGASPR